MSSGNRRIIRERNEHGFALFLQNLKSVVSLLTRVGEQEVEMEILIETRHRLLDANGTLSLLSSDLTRDGANPTGLPSNHLRVPVEHLKLSLTQLISLLSDMIDTSNADFNDQLDIFYSTPVETVREGPGRKRLQISKDQLEHLRSLYFSWEKISSILNVSLSTIRRRRADFGLSERFEKYSSVTNDELDVIYRSITNSASSGPLTPNIGRRFIGALRSRGLNIQRRRVSECLRRNDPVGTALRWRMTIHRRKYFVPTPNSLWHIDSGHKLIRYKLITHVCIDGKTRLILYAACRNNNKAETVLMLFESAVHKWGLPSRVRSDSGMENYHVAAYMIRNRGEGRGSIITGSSVHNSRVERTHRDVYSGVLVFYARIFEQLEADGYLNVMNDVHLFSLHHIYIPRIENSLQELVGQLNNRPISTERNLSPLQLWEMGMLENMHSDHTALSETEVESFGIDPGSVLAIEDQDYQVQIHPPILHLTDEQISQLPDPLANDENSGKEVYLQTVETLNMLTAVHADN